MMSVFGPVTRVRNHTRDVMLLITRNNAFQKEEGVQAISPGGHVYLRYRKGIGRIGGGVTFLVQPESRSGVPGKEMLPIRVYKYASIDVVYRRVNGSVCGQYEDGALIDLDFSKDTPFRRIGIVRWFAGVFAAFGNCYHAPPAPAGADPSPDHCSVIISDVPVAAAQI